MHGEGFFYQAFIYLVAAVLSVPLAKRLGLGSVLGYLVAGIVIGPFGLELVGEEGQDVLHFAEFGVVMMLFLIGLELQPSLLWRMRASILGLGGLQVGATASAIAAIGVALGLDWRTSVAIGLTLALSSTAIVLQTLQEKNLMKTAGGESSFAVLLFQDLAVIPILAAMPLLAHGGRAAGAVHQSVGHSATWVDGLPGWAATLAVLGAVAVIVVLGRTLIRPAFRIIARAHVPEIFTAAALLLVIGIALLMTKVGLSPALGTFLAGVVLATSEYRHELESDIEPFKALLLGLFFIAVGASIDFQQVAARPMLVGGVVAGLMVLKFVILLVLGRIFRLSLDANLLFAFALAQGGEFGFVLFSFATQRGVLGPELTTPLIAAVALTMALTPLALLVNEKLVRPHLGTRERVDREPDEMTGGQDVIIAGYGRVGTVVGRLLRANGIDATVLDLDSDHVEMLRNLGHRVFYGDASRVDLLRAAGAESARLLVVAVDDPDRILEIVECSRKHFPDLEIFARATTRNHAYELLDTGIDRVYRESLDTSIRIGVDVLNLLGMPAYEAHRRALTFRNHDEKSLRELRGSRADRATYIRSVRLQTEILEELLKNDDTDIHLERDAAWDAESLREEFGQETTKS